MSSDERPRRGWETVIGLEVHVRAGDRDEAVLRLPQRVRRRAEHQRVPGVPRPARVAAGAQRAGGRVRAAVGEALHFDVPEQSIFHRKNYFYPDMPKDYQTSQYDEPICDRRLARGRRRARRHRARAPRGGHRQALHVGGGGRIHDADHSLVDYNRAGVPLLEIVSEPDIRSRRAGASATSTSCARRARRSASPT